MNNPIRILFDENFGEPLVSALAKLIKWHDPPIEICHLFEFAGQGEGDEAWIPKIKTGGWLVITNDRGKRCGGRKLPDICHENQVSHVLLSGTLSQAKQFEKIRAFISVLPEIIRASESRLGSRFSLRYDNTRNRVILIECEVVKSGGFGTPLPRMGFPSQQKGSRKSAKRPAKKRYPLHPTLPWPEQGELDRADENRK